jgi:GAF domain-containing protein
MQDDLAAVGAIDAVPNILRVVCQTTGLGFAAVARVTEEKWTALAVRDEIGFGLEPGGELDLVTTICNEIRQSGEPVVIDHVDVDPYFRDHHTPRMYGFQSYISVPVTFRDGTFFGTLCAIDPKPAQLRDSTALTTLKLFAELIALHLENRERVA